jgi:dipeptidyl aminopeptidase/acylaminoacyl peptidase
MRIALLAGLLFASSLALSQVGPPPKLLEANITYMSGALRIKAFTVRLDGAQRLPAVILNHGGTDGVTWATKQRARDLARAGYAVFASAYRGEGGSDGAIEIAAGEVDDVLNGMKWFAKQTYVDASRIGMLGSSHGALIGLLAASRTAQIKALVFAYGVADIYAWYAYLVESKQLGTDAITRRVYGNGPQDKPQQFLQRHGLRVVPRLPNTMPILIQQGALDVIVPPAQARALAAELTRFKKPFTLEVFPNSAHGFVTAREAVIKRFGADSVQALESGRAWRQAVTFLNSVLEPQR